ncbi:acyl-CoA synthetase [Cupriavidus alkaliphilus]|uniref:acyl-CoA synthetase n=1 Tax=Cupriavidus alkaliphilus TaxID=942866 RepID=UPI00160F1B76|nr:acyl-CoA synthetase [Cupriavidus alkaliphilus]MBB2919337.1 fatty-acyl-CoA synthase [Cupriavidus alkaliphilus]
MENWSYLGEHARLTPDKLAVINGNTGARLTYSELDQRSIRFARALQSFGLEPGDGIAMVLENNIRCFEICWAALRTGLCITPINRFLTPDEVAYIVDDCKAKVIVSSLAMRELAEGLAMRVSACDVRLMVDGMIDGWRSYETCIAAFSANPLEEETLGTMVLYSSGTTGKPKGVVRVKPSKAMRDFIPEARRAQVAPYGFSEDMVYLSTAPLYHSAPLGWALQTAAIGGTVVYMEKFDPAHALQLIERYGVTHSQWVPTMFVRLLKLTEGERRRHDLSSLRMAVHAAAPCPVDVKRRMIAWWGPIIHEYFGATEGNGLTMIDSETWLSHPGSVGRSVLGVIHVCDDEGRELPPGESGLIYFERDSMPFHYLGDPAKTRAVQHPRHPTWTAVGDMGYVDEDGFLYLTDRKTFMIISGGVNIYPQAIEDALVTHGKVADAAVIGVPDAEMGETVKAIIEPAEGVAPSAELAEELLRYLRGRVARYMVPKSIDFTDKLPRLPTGKLYKQALRERYRTADAFPVVAGR